MIDLHIHTSLSDGDQSPQAVLATAAQLGLSVVSITDHNHALAYPQLAGERAGYTGVLVPGTELATSFEGYVIELLGYGIDSQAINDWYADFYSGANLDRNEHELFDRLLAICDRVELEYSPGLAMDHIEKGISKKTVYQDVAAHPANAGRGFPLDTYKSFFRQGLSNPASPLFVHEDEQYPGLVDTVQLIHDAGGLAFLAHLFVYDVPDHLGFLHRLLAAQPKASPAGGLDGLECRHSDFTPAQCDTLTAYADEHGLFKSGGSDFHGGRRVGVELGSGRGGLDVPDEFVAPWLEQVR